MFTAEIVDVKTSTSVVTGVRTVFTTFVSWEDEGYFFQLYRHFLSGRLYDQLISIYGPMTFFCGAVARFHPGSVTHDLFRWATLPVWVLIAFLFADVVCGGRENPARR